MITEITLSGVLPAVFAGMAGEEPMCNSQVWLHDVRLQRGRRYIIHAESGTGKSSLCSFIYGNRRDYSGTILFDGIDIRTLGINGWCDVRRSAIALLPQEMRLFPELTVMENIELKNSLTGFRSSDEIHRMLAELEIENKADTPAGLLSIGQQQRVAIARALVTAPTLLLADEPTGALDSQTGKEILALFQRLNEMGNTIIMITHDLSVAQHSKRIARLVDGVLSFQG